MSGRFSERLNHKAMTKEEIISAVKIEFKGEFCYTALKTAMERYAIQQVLEFGEWFEKSSGRESHPFPTISDYRVFIQLQANENIKQQTKSE